MNRRSFVRFLGLAPIAAPFAAKAAVESAASIAPVYVPGRGGAIHLAMPGEFRAEFTRQFTLARTAFDSAPSYADAVEIVLRDCKRLASKAEATS